jgi:hypothetical protein
MQDANAIPWTGVNIQGSADDGKTWKTLEAISRAPISLDWLTAYVGGGLGAYHGTLVHLQPNGTTAHALVSHAAAALADEVEWRNANRTPYKTTLYRLEPSAS